MVTRSVRKRRVSEKWSTERVVGTTSLWRCCVQMSPGPQPRDEPADADSGGSRDLVSQVPHDRRAALYRATALA